MPKRKAPAEGSTSKRAKTKTQKAVAEPEPVLPIKATTTTTTTTTTITPDIKTKAPVEPLELPATNQWTWLVEQQKLYSWTGLGWNLASSTVTSAKFVGRVILQFAPSGLVGELEEHDHEERIRSALMVYGAIDPSTHIDIVKAGVNPITALPFDSKLLSRYTLTSSIVQELNDGRFFVASHENYSIWNPFEETVTSSDKHHPSQLGATSIMTFPTAGTVLTSSYGGDATEVSLDGSFEQVAHVRSSSVDNYHLTAVVNDDTVIAPVFLPDEDWHRGSRNHYHFQVHRRTAEGGWTPEEILEKSEFVSREHFPHKVAVLDDGVHFVAAGSGAEYNTYPLHIWNVDTNERVKTVKLDSVEIDFLVALDNKRFATASQSPASIRIWAAKPGTCTWAVVATIMLKQTPAESMTSITALNNDRFAVLFKCRRLPPRVEVHQLRGKRSKQLAELYGDPSVDRIVAIQGGERLMAYGATALIWDLEYADFEEMPSVIVGSLQLEDGSVVTLHKSTGPDLLQFWNPGQEGELPVIIQSLETPEITVPTAYVVPDGFYFGTMRYHKADGVWSALEDIQDVSSRAGCVVLLDGDTKVSYKEGSNSMDAHNWETEETQVIDVSEQGNYPWYAFYRRLEEPLRPLSRRLVQLSTYQSSAVWDIQAGRLVQSNVGTCLPVASSRLVYTQGTSVRLDGPPQMFVRPLTDGGATEEERHPILIEGAANMIPDAVVGAGPLILAHLPSSNKIFLVDTAKRCVVREVLTFVDSICGIFYHDATSRMCVVGSMVGPVFYSLDVAHVVSA